MICLYCKSESVVKYGKRKCRKGLIQVYKCKSCSRRFTPQDGFRRMKYSKKIICSCLDMYAKGMSLRAVRHHIKMFHGIEVSHVAILYWVRHYGKMINDFSRKLKPKTSSKWYADETQMKFKGSNNWLWCVMDAKSRFWIASHVSNFRSQIVCDYTFPKATSMVSSKPREFLTDGAMYYRSVPENFLRKDTKHIRYFIKAEKTKMQIMERLNGNIKQRFKVTRGMYDLSTSQKLFNFWQAYYNFIRPHVSLNGATPDASMGLNLGLSGNKWEQLLRGVLNDIQKL